MSNTKTVMGQASNQYVVPLDITDVFSTYLYTGTASPLTITNGIDLAGEGGLVWTKGRSVAYSHSLVDTERGGSSIIFSNVTNSENALDVRFSSFNSDGYSLAQSAGGNFHSNGATFASWTFRKAPKFFDVVTYTGDGTTNREITHSLNSEVGFIAIKRTDASANWTCRHRSTGGDSVLVLNNSNASFSSGTRTLTSDYFTVGNGDTLETNQSNGTYVAYLFAHNDGDGGFGPSGDQDIIKCGSFTGGTDGYAVVDLGWEPQWLLIKRTDSTNNWLIYDTMRGWANSVSYADDAYLLANSSDAEGLYSAGEPNSTGFRMRDTSSSGATFIYMAIRRGPLAPPESATEVFDVVTYTGDGTNGRQISSGFVTDMTIGTRTAEPRENEIYARLTSNKDLETDSTSAEGSGSVYFDTQDGILVNANYSNYSGKSQISWLWKRAPGFFDVVAYEGDGQAGRTVSHNLGVAPEMMIFKCRNTSDSWFVYAAPVFGQTGFDLLSLSDSDALPRYTNNVFSSTPVSDTSFNFGSYTGLSNGAGNDYIAYLFASLPGISKVGSFSHTTGSATNVDCGFTSGARFVLWKEVDALGDWSVFDTARGIVSGNDPELTLNSTAAESSLDKIDPLSSGFTVSSSVYNDSGNYIFYAIA